MLLASSLPLAQAFLVQEFSNTDEAISTAKVIAVIKIDALVSRNFHMTPTATLNHRVLQVLKGNLPLGPGTNLLAIGESRERTRYPAGAIYIMFLRTNAAAPRSLMGLQTLGFWKKGNRSTVLPVSPRFVMDEKPLKDLPLKGKIQHLVKEYLAHPNPDIKLDHEFLKELLKEVAASSEVPPRSTRQCLPGSHLSALIL